VDDRSEGLERALQSLRESVRDLEARVVALEGAAAGPVRPGERAASDTAEVPADLPLPTGEGLGLASGLSLAGGTFLILGGGFLLRALTDSAVLPRGAGIGAGLVYALLWAALAGRAASRGRAAAAGFQAFASAIIAYPLLWEATTRFSVLAPVPSAVCVAIVTAIALALALRHGSAFLAGMFTVTAGATGLGLLFATGEVAGFTILLVSLGVASLWVTYARGWDGPRWFAALVANLAILRLVAPALSASKANAAGPSFLVIEMVALGYLLAYLASFGFRTLARRRDVGVFEILQSALVLALGLGGAAGVSLAAGTGGAGLGLGALVAGAGCYTVAFRFVNRQAGRGRNFFFYASLGLVLFLAGCRLIGGTGPCTAAWGLLAVAAAAVGGRFDRVTLRAHAAVYAVAAAVVSGLLATFGHIASGAIDDTWHTGGWGLYALGAAFAAYLLLVATRSFRRAPRLARLPRTVLALVSLLGIATVLVIFGTRLSMQSSVGALAAIRSIVVAGGAIALAALYHRVHLPELAWLAWGLLGIGALKLAVQDLRAGGAGPLFLAFAVYGLALIIVPRLLRTAPKQPATP
jgi:hypothetical protein